MSAPRTSVLDASHVYNTFGKNGLQYQRAFQGLHTVHSGGGSDSASDAKFSFSDIGDSQSKLLPQQYYVVHPVSLDLAFQLSGTLFMGGTQRASDGEHLYVPAGIKCLMVKSLFTGEAEWAMSTAEASAFAGDMQSFSTRHTISNASSLEPRVMLYEMQSKRLIERPDIRSAASLRPENASMYDVSWAASSTDELVASSGCMDKSNAISIWRGDSSSGDQHPLLRLKADADDVDRVAAVLSYFQSSSAQSQQLQMCSMRAASAASDVAPEGRRSGRSQHAMEAAIRSLCQEVNADVELMKWSSYARSGAQRA